jgi:hypothetical protein
MSDDDLSQFYPLGGMEEIDDVTYRWDFVNRSIGTLNYSENDGKERLKQFSETSKEFQQFIKSQAEKIKKFGVDKAPQRSQHPYAVYAGHISLKEKDKEGRFTSNTPTALANFDARITQAVTYDDGAVQRKFYKITGKQERGSVFPEIVVPVEQFSHMEWVAQWDGRAVVHVGKYFKDHARAAIQFLSNEKGYEARYVYSHVGWRQFDGGWHYLHAGGAIDAHGLNADIDVEFTDARLSVFDLPEPPNGDELNECILSVISLLDDATLLQRIPEWLVYFDIPKVFRAPLNEVLPITTSDFMAGLTGVRKTAYKALWQAFYGAGFNSGTLPGNWSSTANQIERLLYVFKDAVCEIDDFKPLGNATKVQQKHNDADRVLRNHANKQGRGRLKQNSDFAVTYYSRAFPSSSGEDIPIGESLRGRMVIREIQKNDVDISWLTEAQEQASNGVFVKVMSAFLKWLAPQIDTLKESDALRILRDEKREEYREKMQGEGAHDRTPEALADLYIGFFTFMRFVREFRVIDDSRANELTEICEETLLRIGIDQAPYIRSEEPTTQFLGLISALLSSGRAHLCDLKTNYVPNDPYAPRLLGWMQGREQTQTNDEGYVTNVAQMWIAKGPCIGWIDETMVYLEPNAAYVEAQKMARDQGASIPFTQTILYDRMKQRGIIEGDPEDYHTGKQKKIGGKNKRVLWIAPNRILGEEVE